MKKFFKTLFVVLGIFATLVSIFAGEYAVLVVMVGISLIGISVLFTNGEVKEAVRVEEKKEEPVKEKVIADEEPIKPKEETSREKDEKIAKLLTDYVKTNLKKGHKIENIKGVMVKRYPKELVEKIIESVMPPKQPDELVLEEPEEEETGEEVEEESEEKVEEPKPEPEKFKCPKCGKDTFDSEKKMRRHYGMSHYDTLKLE